MVVVLFVYHSRAVTFDTSQPITYNVIFVNTSNFYNSN